MLYMVPVIQSVIEVNRMNNCDYLQAVTTVTTDALENVKNKNSFALIQKVGCIWMKLELIEPS